MVLRLCTTGFCADGQVGEGENKGLRTSGAEPTERIIVMEANKLPRSNAGAGNRIAQKGGKRKKKLAGDKG